MVKAAPTLAERVVAAMVREDRATRALGIKLVSVEEGACCVEMKIREDMLNGHTTCHGGILFTLADTAFGIACNSRNQRTVAAAGHIDFLRPALLNDVLRATAIERSVGSRLGLYDVTLTNQRNQTIALFRGKSCRIEGSIIEDPPVVLKKVKKPQASLIRSATR
jgi:acyl-CoA thioesterase